MKHRKIVQLLKLLSSEERTQFHHFIQSPYFNLKDKAAVALYHYLLKNAVIKDAPRLSLENASKAVYKGQKFNKKKIENKCSDLVKLVEDFLSHHEYKKQHFERQFNLAQAFKRKKADDLFFEQLEVCNENLDKLPNRSLWFYSQKLKLAHEQYFHPNTQKYSNSDAKKMLDDVLHLLDKVFILGKLRYGMEAKNRELLLEENYSIEMWNSTLETAKKDDYKNLPLIKIYLEMLTMLDRDNTINIAALKQSFKDNIIYESKEGQGALSTFIINFLWYQLVEGKTEIKAKLLEFYEIFLEQKTLEQEGYLSYGHFINIGVLGADLEGSEWTEDFIEKHASKVKYYCDDAVKVVKAHMYFAELNFKEAEHNLWQLELPNVDQNLRAKTLLVRCYFELTIRGEKTLVQRYCKTFHSYLTRSEQLSDEHKAPFINFINAVRKLLILWKKKEDAQDLLADIEAQQALVCKNWLREKCQLLWR